ncbi:unnamed protein product [Cylicostephanus goldi]|uniref:Anaphase-promoting complex subunit 4 WD40 domain-containing protein n=1 Tax=Cylicostephanus goldi TaxID=71465 RepID=A0A3P7MBY5_CYLGO|nr:unnamed protein product [Cylicostephanus goldi]
MLDIEKMDMATLISALVGILVIMISSIFFFITKESQESKREEELPEEGEEEGAGDAPHAESKKGGKGRKNDQWKAKLAVYKLVKKEAGGTYKFVHVENVSFPSPHTLDISHCGISSTGKYLMSASPDMKIVLYDIHGNILKILEPKLSTLFDAVLSPDGRFVAVCGFTPDVIVYDVTFNREGVFQDAKKAFNLTDHHSGVFSVAFNSNASRAVTVSRDGFWRVFDTDIRYNAGQETQVINK